MSSKRKEFFGRAGLFLEVYFFMPLAFYFALDKGVHVVRNYGLAAAVFRKILLGSADIFDLRFFTFFLADFLLIFYNIIVGLGLMFRKNIYKKPDSFVEIFIPILSTIFMNVFNFLNYSAKGTILLPVATAWIPWFSLAGSLLVFAGLAFGSWGLFYLKDSFAVFVEVRDIVTDGPYRYVRHPIYFGYILQLMGLCMVYVSYFALALTVITIGFFWIRARLEERKIAGFSESYRHYQQKTPFLFPSFKLKLRIRRRSSF